MRRIFLMISLAFALVPFTQAQVPASHNVTIVIPRVTTSTSAVPDSAWVSARLARVYSNVRPGKIVVSRDSRTDSGRQTEILSTGSAHLVNLSPVYTISERPIEGHGVGLPTVAESPVVVTITD